MLVWECGDDDVIGVVNRVEIFIMYIICFVKSMCKLSSGYLFWWYDS